MEFQDKNEKQEREYYSIKRDAEYRKKYIEQFDNSYFELLAALKKSTSEIDSLYIKYKVSFNNLLEYLTKEEIEQYSKQNYRVLSQIEQYKKMETNNNVKEDNLQEQKYKQKLVDDIESSYLELIDATKKGYFFNLYNVLKWHLFLIKNAGSLLSKEELDYYFSRCQPIIDKINKEIKEKQDNRPTYMVNSQTISRIRFPGHEVEVDKKTK